MRKMKRNKNIKNVLYEKKIELELKKENELRSNNREDRTVQG